MRASSASVEMEGATMGEAGSVGDEVDEVEDCRVSSFFNRVSTPDMRLRKLQAESAR